MRANYDIPLILLLAAEDKLKGKGTHRAKCRYLDLVGVQTRRHDLYQDRVPKGAGAYRTGDHIFMYDRNVEDFIWFTIDHVYIDKAVYRCHAPKAWEQDPKWSYWKQDLLANKLP